MKIFSRSFVFSGLILLTTLPLFGQGSIEELSRALFNTIVQGKSNSALLYLDKATYHQYIDDQKFGKVTTDEYKIQVNDRFDTELQEYVEAVQKLQEGYKDAIMEGGSFQLGNVHSEKMPGVINTYSVDFQILLSYPDEELDLTMRYTAVLVNQKWYIMGKPEEDQ